MTTTPTTTTSTLTLDGLDVAVTVTDQGSGRTFLLLHGGAGPQSVVGFADLLTSERAARVLIPTHPGFNGTPRPEQLSGIRDLAQLYAALVDELDLDDVTVVGNSIGGWIAAELALLGNPRITGLVLVNAVGLALADDPIADFFSLTMDQVADLAYFRPDGFRIDVTSLPEPVRAIMAANRETLLTYAGTEMADASLLGRLPAMNVATLVAWGTADRMVPIGHAHRYAAVIPGAELDLIDTAGHLPQLETPERLAADVWAFSAR